jgi:hypothetical protein
LTNILLYGYYYRFKEHRKQIKNLVDTGQDYTLALSKLTTAIQEHNTKYPNNNKRDFNFGEKITMEHAKDHLEAVIDKNDPSFIDSNGNIKHQSDLVKEGLLHQPKQDYSDTD